MKVTHVALRPAEAATNAGRPSLTPELLAATGARYSRSNEGLDAILSRIDPNNLDKSVDGIFKMVDYGHQSIADMAPVAIFLDGVSLWLAYYLWTLSPVAGGQESSTRYIKMTDDGVLPFERTGLPESERDAWRGHIAEAFAAYQTALGVWEGIVANEPERARIQQKLLSDNSDKARRTVARMARNYAFDRARYFLPTACLTNVMLVMSARAWVTVCQHLLSHSLPEAREAGVGIQGELALTAPRLLRHAVAKPSFEQGLRREFADLQNGVINGPMPRALTAREARGFDAAPEAFLESFAPREFGSDLGEHFHYDLEFHDNRYAYLGETLRRTGVRFGWDAVAFAEIRDLNRHRTGTKYCPFVPQGFYHAADQLPEDFAGADAYETLGAAGGAASAWARDLLGNGEASYVYGTLLGTQFPFEHMTTADKFLY